MKRRAKIVCTLGPASREVPALTALVDAGMDMARLNFSHDTQASHAVLYQQVRRIAVERGRPVAVLADLQGPKIRLGRFAAGPVQWNAGEHVTITTDPVLGDHERVSTTYIGLAADVRPGDRLLVDDGRVELRVLDTTEADVRCLVTHGGPVSDHKGISLPGVAVNVPPLSEKDGDDLRFALDLGVDMVAMSFVRAPEEVRLAHAIMDEVGRRVPVIAKLEKPEAVTNLPAIVEAFDGLMVARGDLGVEMPLEQVPHVQKEAIRLCRRAAKPVIVATQMLDSMVADLRPTRAEVSDVANAVLDGADAVMLSAETSVGAHPAHTVATMACIVTEAEKASVDAATTSKGVETDACPDPRTGDAIAAAASEIGNHIGAVALCCFTRTGDTARRLARQRSPLPLLAFAHDESQRSQLALSWGVEAAVLAPTTADSLPRDVSRALLETGRYQAGDLVVVVSGSQGGVPGSTDSLRVLRVDPNLIARHAPSPANSENRPRDGRQPVRWRADVSTATPPEIRMVNNIAVQFVHLPAGRAAEEVTNHVLRFWDPQTRSRLLTLAAGGTEDLEPVARAAVDLVRDHASSAAPTTANHGDVVSVRTADGWLEVDVAAPQARLALRNALGIRELVEGQERAGGLPIAQVRAAIEQVSMQWSTAEVLLALEQEDVGPRRSSVDPGLIAP